MKRKPDCYAWTIGSSRPYSRVFMKPRETVSMETRQEVQQVISANPGWMAVYAKQEEDIWRFEWAEPVVLWGVYEWLELHSGEWEAVGRSVEGVVNSNDGLGLERAERENFVGYRSPKQEWEVFVKVAIGDDSFVVAPEFPLNHFSRSL